jgi:Ras-related protein Rab-6A
MSELLAHRTGTTKEVAKEIRATCLVIDS